MTRQIFHPHALMIALLLSLLVVTGNAAQTIVGTLLVLALGLVLSAIWELWRHG
jgi:chromate transport protein ChrA